MRRESTVSINPKGPYFFHLFSGSLKGIASCWSDADEAGEDAISPGTGWSVPGAISLGGDETAKEVGPLAPGCGGPSCKYADPSCNCGGDCEIVGPSGGGVEEVEGRDSSGSGSPRSLDMAATFLTATGTATLLCAGRASGISRTTGAANARLKMERRRRVPARVLY